MNWERTLNFIPGEHLGSCPRCTAVPYESATSKQPGKKVCALLSAFGFWVLCGLRRGAVRGTFNGKWRALRVHPARAFVRVQLSLQGGARKVRGFRGLRGPGELDPRTQKPRDPRNLRTPQTPGTPKNPGTPETPALQGL